jgi:hypothetical protein
MLKLALALLYAVTSVALVYVSAIAIARAFVALNAL